MEFYKSCSRDIIHWVDDVATMKFDLLSRIDDAFGGFIIFPSLDEKFIISEYKYGATSFQKGFKNSIESIRYFKKKIVDSKKYNDLLKVDSKGKVLWRHSDEYYKTFFEYLALLLDFRISPKDIPYFGISDNGGVWEKPRIISPKPISPKEKSISKREFQNLILEYIYYLNYEDFDRNTELVRRVQK